MSNDVNNLIHARFFLEVGDGPTALGLSQSICEKLLGHGKVSIKSIEKYWKIPEYYEVSIVVSSEELTLDALSVIAHDLGSGWVVDNISYMIWTPSTHSNFIINEVRWAQLELIIAE